MRYAETVILKDGVELLVRNAVASDARALRDIMRRTHAETDYLLGDGDRSGAHGIVHRLCAPGGLCPTRARGGGW